MLTLLPEQLHRPVSTLWKALDLPNSLVAIPGSLAAPYIPKKPKKTGRDHKFQFDRNAKISNMSEL